MISRNSIVQNSKTFPERNAKKISSENSLTLPLNLKYAQKISRNYDIHDHVSTNLSSMVIGIITEWNF